MTSLSQESVAVASILEDWRSRHRHWSLMEVFLPVSQRQQAPYLFAWYEAIESATFEVNDDAVALAKLRWWRDELNFATEGKARHPLMQVCSPLIGRISGSWDAVVDAALRLRMTQPRPANLQESWQAVEILAGAQSNLEQALWGGREDSAWRCADLLLTRLRRHAGPHAERSLLPLDLCARHALPVELIELGSSEPHQRGWQLDWVSALNQEMPQQDIARARASTLWSVATRLHLRALANPQQRQVSTMAAWVWYAWQSARRAAG